MEIVLGDEVLQARLKDFSADGLSVELPLEAWTALQARQELEVRAQLQNLELRSTAVLRWRRRPKTPGEKRVIAAGLTLTSLTKKTRESLDLMAL